MTKKPKTQELINREDFWNKYALEIIPEKAKLLSVEYVPKTTFELTYVSPNYKQLYWLVLVYEQNGEKFRTKISVS